jgi:putative redox protein
LAAEKVFFPNGRGQQLAGYLELPEGGEPRACGLFAHCFTCSKDYKALFHISRTLADRGIAVLRFDFTGLGESEGEFSETDVSSTVEDVVAAAGFLEAELEPAAVLLGHSLGAVAAMKAAQRVPSCRAVIAIAAPFNPGGGELLQKARALAAVRGEAEVSFGGRTLRLKRAFFEDVGRVKVQQIARELGRPLLVFHSPTDEITEVADALRLLEAARFPKAFVAVDGADHLLSAKADALFVGAVAGSWLERYVG